MAGGYSTLGVLTRLHGYRGEFMLISENLLEDYVEELEQVFLMIEGIPVPFFISSIEWHSDKSVIIGFDEISDEMTAASYVGTEVQYVPPVSEISREADPDLEDLIGYQVKDAQHGVIGKISEILYYGENVLFSIESPDGKEILVPVHEDIIEMIDEKSSIVQINAPEGLMDLFS